MEMGQLPSAGHLAVRNKETLRVAADFPMLVAVDNVGRRFARHFELSPDQAA